MSCGFPRCPSGSRSPERSGSRRGQACAAAAGDVNLDDVARGALVERVDRVLQLPAAQHVAGMLERKASNSVYSWAPSRRRFRSSVTVRVAGSMRRVLGPRLSGRAARCAAAQARNLAVSSGRSNGLTRCAHPRRHRGRELVGEAIAGRRYQHRRGRGQLAQCRQQREPVAVGVAPGRDRARIVAGQAGARRAEAFRPIHHVRFLRQEISNGQAERRVVFDQKYPHRASVRTSPAILQRRAANCAVPHRASRRIFPAASTGSFRSVPDYRFKLGTVAAVCVFLPAPRTMRNGGRHEMNGHEALVTPRRIELEDSRNGRSYLGSEMACARSARGHVGLCRRCWAFPAYQDALFTRFPMLLLPCKAAWPATTAVQVAH